MVGQEAQQPGVLRLQDGAHYSGPRSLVEMVEGDVVDDYNELVAKVRCRYGRHLKRWAGLDWRLLEIDGTGLKDTGLGCC